MRRCPKRTPPLPPHNNALYAALAAAARRSRGMRQARMPDSSTTWPARAIAVTAAAAAKASQRCVAPEKMPSVTRIVQAPSTTLATPIPRSTFPRPSATAAAHCRPDERFLYVGNWDPEAKVVVRYDLAGGNRRDVLFDMTGAPGEDAIDGLAVDDAGTVFACGPGGIWVISPDGRHLDTIELPEAPHNLAWGDADGRTLYVTALTSIYRLRPKEYR